MYWYLNGHRIFRIYNIQSTEHASPFFPQSSPFYPHTIRISPLQGQALRRQSKFNVADQKRIASHQIRLVPFPGQLILRPLQSHHPPKSITETESTSQSGLAECYAIPCSHCDGPAYTFLPLIESPQKLQSMSSLDEDGRVGASDAENTCTVGENFGFDGPLTFW